MLTGSLAFATNSKIFKARFTAGTTGFSKFSISIILTYSEFYMEIPLKTWTYISYCYISGLFLSTGITKIASFIL